MKKYMSTFLLLLLATTSHAETYFKYGLGVFNSARDNRAEVKTFALGHQEKILNSVVYQFEGGMWADSRGDLGRKSSGFGNMSIGLDVQAGYVYTQALWGLGFITTTDSMLGGNFQFNNDLGVGIRDQKGYAIGLNYKHMSSAGIYDVNAGRDLLYIKMGFPF
jgi:hypothetical protein